MSISKPPKSEVLFKFAEIVAGTVGGQIGKTLFDLFVKDPNSQSSVDYHQEILDAISSMDADLKKEIRKEFDEQNILNATTAINDWLDNGLKPYLREKTNKKEKKTKKKLSKDLKDNWQHEGNIDYHAIELLSNDKASSNLKIDGFATFWTGCLFRIGYLQEQALLDEDVTNPNDSTWAQNIPDVITKIEDNLKAVLTDATNQRVSYMDSVTGPNNPFTRTVTETQHNVDVMDVRGTKFKTLSSHTFENVPVRWWAFKDYQTEELLQEESHCKMYLQLLHIDGMNYKKIPKQSNTYSHPNAHDDVVKMHKDHVTKVTTQVCNYYKPYQDALAKLKNLNDNSIPDSMAGLNPSS